MAARVPLFAVRGSAGISMVDGYSFKKHEAFESDLSPRCRVMVFSSDGSLFAWCNSQCVNVVRISDGQLIQQISRPQICFLDFSPKGTYLSTWQPYTVSKDRPQGTNNLEIWDTKSGELVAGFIQKHQDTWRPKWSSDEKVCARCVTNEVHCFHDANFGSVATKLRLQGVGNFELSPGPPPLKLAAYVPGTKGAPSYVRLFRHPIFDGPGAVLANKSFFKADRVTMKWNKKGTAVLVMTIMDVDSSGASYYGEQALHHLSADGESSMVQLAKKGPIYSVEWSPNSREFCVVYGFMPAKATLFDNKCTPLFDFGTGPRNEVHFNPHGNIICLAGFGNLRGNMELWSRKDFKVICKSQASDTTYFEWSPDGQHMLTATTAPRLREGNGYKLWHYTGSLLQETQTGEIWQVKWQNFADGEFQEQPVVCQPASPVKLPAEKAKATAYRPPQMRGKPTPAFKLHEDEPAQNQVKTGQPMSKSASKNQKKREAKARAKQDTGQSEDKQAAILAAKQILGGGSAPTAVVPGDNEKRLRNLKKKLRQIEELKEQQKAGKVLEKNQLEKLKSETALLEEIQSLDLAS